MPSLNSQFDGFSKAVKALNAVWIPLFILNLIDNLHKLSISPTLKVLTDHVGHHMV